MPAVSIAEEAVRAHPHKHHDPRTLRPIAAARGRCCRWRTRLRWTSPQQPAQRATATASGTARARPRLAATAPAPAPALATGTRNSHEGRLRPPERDGSCNPLGLVLSRRSGGGVGSASAVEEECAREQMAAGSLAAVPEWMPMRALSGNAPRRAAAAAASACRGGRSGAPCRGGSCGGVPQQSCPALSSGEIEERSGRRACSSSSFTARRYARMRSA
eukprot:scaffold3678_cov355-Prasinococcus_capsulatus_cf.AAC.10